MDFHVKSTILKLLLFVGILNCFEVITTENVKSLIAIIYYYYYLLFMD